MSAAKATLMLIPFPIMSHLVSAVETAKLLAGRDDFLAVTILVMKLPVDTMISSYIKNSPHPRINFLELEESKSVTAEMMSAKNRALLFVESQTSAVRGAVTEIIKESGRVAGFVLGMFCTPMMDVAKEFNAPAYIYFSSGSAFLGLSLHLQSLHDQTGLDLKEFGDSDKELCIPTYVNPVPTRVWPDALIDKETGFLDFARSYREASGIIINTFLEFESHAINSLSGDDKVPPVYPVGPLIQEGEDEEEESDGKKEIMEWLDQQPDSSVVFLCFGTRGCFERDQVKEIAAALEQSGLRFLWSLRKPPPQGSLEFPGEYENLEQELPEGFLERSLGKGKVIGWAPQMAVLSHSAVGGFVSHCGWNSTLESIWCGVPIAAWPLRAEQQVNAFQVVKELEMGVEIKMDYRSDRGVIVDADTIEKAMRQLMEPENKIRVKVKELKEKSRLAVLQGGSSYNFLGRLINSLAGEANGRVE